MIAYKAFNKDFKCRGFQFEVGKTYAHDGPVVICESGFHACENPLDVLNYYPPTGKFALVEMSGAQNRDGDNSKIASAEITIKAELRLPEFIQRGVEYILSRVNFNDAPATNTGDRSAATNTGNRSAATNTGHRSAATNTGDLSAATNTGDRSAATNTGDQSAAANTGHRSAATNTGHLSAATNTGDRSAATNTGYRSAAEVSGQSSIAAACGREGKAKASAGSAIVLCEYDEDGAMKHIFSAITGNGIKPDVWYTLQNGQPVEVTE